MPCSDLLPCFDTLVVECSMVELYEGRALFQEVADYLGLSGYDPFSQRNAIIVGGRLLQADVIFRAGGGDRERDPVCVSTRSA